MAYREIDPKIVNQREKKFKTKWFESFDTKYEQSDLVIWEDESENITGFQIFFESHGHLEQNVVEWRKGKPIKTGKVDEPGEWYMAPILKFHNSPDNSIIQFARNVFEENCSTLTNEVAKFILDKLIIDKK
jgi:hypothetical protein